MSEFVVASTRARLGDSWHEAIAQQFAHDPACLHANRDSDVQFALDEISSEAWQRLSALRSVPELAALERLHYCVALPCLQTAVLQVGRARFHVIPLASLVGFLTDISIERGIGFSLAEFTRAHAEHSAGKLSPQEDEEQMALCAAGAASIVATTEQLPLWFYP